MRLLSTKHGKIFKISGSFFCSLVKERIKTNQPKKRKGKSGNNARCAVKNIFEKPVLKSKWYHNRKGL